MKVIFGFIVRMVKALLAVGAGLLLSLLLLEGLLRLNPRLLVRGMAADEPVDKPLEVQEYDVRYSDADELYWRPELITAIKPGEDKIETHVRLETDEFGFRNTPPLPGKVDVVVLGRSYSLGAQNPNPWPSLLGEQAGWKVLNLSQPGADLPLKKYYLNRYGQPRHPKWVVIEIQPSIDIFSAGQSPTWLIERIIPPVLRYFFTPAHTGLKPDPPAEAIYPLMVDLPGRKLPLTCCIHYMDTYTVNQASIQGSQSWANFSNLLLDLVKTARNQGMCVAILDAPVKPEIYFPLIMNPMQLNPTLGEAHSLRLQQDGNFGSDQSPPTIQAVIRNLPAGSSLVEEFSRENRLAFISPVKEFQAAVLKGEDPFMLYDSHWNSIGQKIIADLVEQTLQNSTCP